MRLPTDSSRGGLTPALPMPYQVLANAGVRLLRGQLSLTVAAPGVGKTQLWHNLAHRMGVPALYMSADTAQHDVLLRALAIHSGVTVTEAEQWIRDAPGSQWAVDTVAKGRHVDWAFESSVTPDAVKERMCAFAELRGIFPHLVVVDNLSNVFQHGDDELRYQREFLQLMQDFAGESRAHIAVLHHAKGEYDGGLKPIPQSGSLNNLFKVPSLGLTLHRADDAGKWLGVSVVKNRGGKSDPGAKNPVVLEVDFARAAVYGFKAAA